MSDVTEGPAELRAALDRAVKDSKAKDATIVSLEGEVKGTRIATAGFPVGTDGHRVLTDFYTGDPTDAEAVVAFAAKYGHKPGATAAPVVPSVDDVEGGDQDVTSLGGSATPTDPPGGNAREDLEKRINELEGTSDRADIAERISLKNRLYELQRSQMGR